MRVKEDERSREGGSERKGEKVACGRDDAAPVTRAKAGAFSP